jgi:hypothetical protein
MSECKFRPNSGEGGCVIFVLVFICMVQSCSTNSSVNQIKEHLGIDKQGEVKREN